MTSTQRANAIFALLISVAATGLMLVGPEFLPKTQKDAPLYTSPLFFPFIALSITLISALALTVKSMNNLKIILDMDVQGTTPKIRLVAILLLLFSAYCLLIPVLGYFIASFLFLVIAMFIVGFRGIRLWIQALVFTVLLYLLFIQGLDVWFPESWLSEAL